MEAAPLVPLQSAGRTRRSVRVLRVIAGAAGAAGAAVLMGVPTDVIPNPWFTRMTPVRALDVVFLVLTSITLGALAATYVGARRGGATGRGLAGGTMSGLAIGCPICNKAVVALLGTSGALTWFGPFQPVLGAAGLGLAVWALYLRVRRPEACPAPA